jgi:hypothetical protein
LRISQLIEARSYVIHTVNFLGIDTSDSGFGLDGLGVNHKLFYCTSKAEYAMKAFDYDATDPPSKNRCDRSFNSSVKKAIDHLSKWIQ